MKKTICLFAALGILFIFAGCKNKQTAQSSSEMSSAFGVQVDENQNTVEITIPAGLAGENSGPALTEEQKQSGFKEARINNDGSVTYKIDKEKYKAYLKGLREETKEIIENLNNDGIYKSIKKIECNDDISKVVITADREEFESGMESVSVYSVGLSGMMYKYFDIDTDKRITIDVKDFSTGEVFKTLVYPDDLNK